MKVVTRLLRPYAAWRADIRCQCEKQKPPLLKRIWDNIDFIVKQFVTEQTLSEIDDVTDLDRATARESK